MAKGIETYTGGHQPTTDDLDHLNEATRELMNNFVSALRDNGTAGILHGVVFTINGGNVSWTAGAVVLFNQIFNVTAGTAAGSLSSLFAQIVVTYRANNPVLYEDGNLRNVHSIATVTFTANGSFSCETLNVNRFIDMLDARLNRAWTEVEDVNLLNGWTNHSPGFAGTKLAYRKAFGRLEIRGKITSGTLGLALFQLPLAYRPNAIRLFTVVVQQAAAMSVLNGYINNNGNIHLDGTGAFAHLYVDMEISVSLL